MIKLIAEIIGLIGTAANALIYQQNTRQRILKVKLMSDVLWALQFLLNGGYSGLGVSCIGIVRETVFLNAHRKWARGKKWLIVFVISSVFSSLLTYKTPINLLPGIASILSVFSFWRANPKLTRFLSFPICACMLTYALSIGSWSSTLNEVITLVSSTVGVIRYRKSNGLEQPVESSCTKGE